MIGITRPHLIPIFSTKASTSGENFSDIGIEVDVSKGAPSLPTPIPAVILTEPSLTSSFVGIVLDRLDSPDSKPFFKNKSPSRLLKSLLDCDILELKSYVVLLRQAQKADRIPIKGLLLLPQAFAILSRLKGMVMSSIESGSRPVCYLL